MADRNQLLKNLLYWLVVAVLGAAIWWWSTREAAAQELSLPSVPLHYGFFTVQFAADGTFSFDGEGMTAKGTWKRAGTTVEIATAGAPDACSKPARYTFSVAGHQLSLELVGDDACEMRRMV